MGKQRQYLAIDLNNAEKKGKPILSAKTQKVTQICRKYRHYGLIRNSDDGRKSIGFADKKHPKELPYYPYSPVNLGMA